MSSLSAPSQSEIINKPVESVVNTAAAAVEPTVEPIVNNPIINVIEQETNTNKPINPTPTVITAEALVKQFASLVDPLVLAQLNAVINNRVDKPVVTVIPINPPTINPNEQETNTNKPITPTPTEPVAVINNNPIAEPLPAITATEPATPAVIPPVVSVIEQETNTNKAINPTPPAVITVEAMDTAPIIKPIEPVEPQPPAPVVIATPINSPIINSNEQQTNTNNPPTPIPTPSPVAAPNNTPVRAKVKPPPPESHINKPTYRPMTMKKPVALVNQLAIRHLESIELIESSDEELEDYTIMNNNNANNNTETEVGDMEDEAAEDNNNNANEQEEEPDYNENNNNHMDTANNNNTNSNYNDPDEACVACKNNDNPDLQLQCESCDVYVHFYCNKPNKLKGVPDQDYYCRKCLKDKIRVGQLSKNYARSYTYNQLGKIPMVGVNNNNNNNRACGAPRDSNIKVNEQEKKTKSGRVVKRKQSFDSVASDNSAATNNNNSNSNDNTACAVVPTKKPKSESKPRMKEYFIKTEFNALTMHRPVVKPYNSCEFEVCFYPYQEGGDLDIAHLIAEGWIISKQLEYDVAIVKCKKDREEAKRIMAQSKPNAKFSKKKKPAA
jgi:hypothetical protein